tara:strand:+ start:66156 stop:66782 length:627 start_codon:yes stop_codon:yes gene_type:complete
MKEETLNRIKPYYQTGDPSHDWNHIRRVVNTCYKFGKALGADLEVLIPAAYLHDVVSIPKNSDERSQASQMAANLAAKILEEEGLSKSVIEKICQVIKEHSFSSGLKATSLEAQILQDADRLDAMGAIGVMRWNTCGTLMKASYYHADDPWGVDRKLDDRHYSLDHFETKLLRLKEMLNTEPAKKEGEKRNQFFLTFLSSLRDELNQS